MALSVVSPPKGLRVIRDPEVPAEEEVAAAGYPEPNYPAMSRNNDPAD